MNRYAADMELMRRLSRFSRTRSARMGAAVLALGLTISADATDVRREAGSASSPRTAFQEQPHMWMTIDNHRFALRLEDNPTARAFMQLLPISLEMAELNGNEKHASLPRKLPTNAARPGTIRAGDVLLYGDNTLVVFYETFRSSYSYTRIGRIEDSGVLAKAMGPGNPRVVFTAP